MESTSLFRHQTELALYIITISILIVLFYWPSATPNIVLHYSISVTKETIRTAASSEIPLSEEPSNQINYLYLSRNIFKIALNHYLMYFLETLKSPYVKIFYAHIQENICQSLRRY